MNNPYSVDPITAYIFLAICGCFLVYLMMRLWSGNMGRGDANRRPVGLPAALGFALGSLTLVAFYFGLGAESWHAYEWTRALNQFTGFESITDLVTAVIKGYASYPQSVILNVSYETFGPLPRWAVEIWDWVSLVGVVLVAIPLLSMAVRRMRGRPMIGPIQDFYIGFLAPIGLAPIGAFFYGIFIALVLLFCLAFLGIVNNFFRPVVRRS